MVKVKLTWIVFVLVAVSSWAQAQTNSYVVFFTDKNNSPFDVAQPQEFLSSRAISRRIAQQIPVIEEDLPVNPGYLSGLGSTGVDVLFSSKWFNAAIINSTPLEAENLKLLTYVSDVEYVAPGTGGGRSKNDEKFKKTKVSGSDSLFQNDILDIPEMHADGFKGEGIIIGVLDGGFSGTDNIEAFQKLRDEGRIAYAYNFIGRSQNVYQYTDHGTKVLSLMAADWPRKSYIGVAPNASYALIVTENSQSEYRVEEYYWAVGAERADSLGVDVLTTSLGYNLFDDPSMNYQPNELDGKTAVITRASQIAAEKGIVFLTSAGNEGMKPWQTITFPADVIDGLAVGSIQPNYSKSIFSSIGPSWDGRVKPDVVAQGSGAFLVSGSGTLLTGSGTSFSAPQVAGLVAGIWQAYPTLTSQEILTTIRGSSDLYDNPNIELGYGVPSYQAMRNFIESENQTNAFAVYPNPVLEDGQLKIRVKDPVADNEVNVRLLDSNGKLILESSVPFSWRINEYILEMTTLPAGLYLVNLRSKDKIEKLKIVKI